MINVGSEEILGIMTEEIKHVLTQIKTRLATTNHSIKTEMLKLGGSETIKIVRLLLKKSFDKNKTPDKLIKCASYPTV